MSTELGVQRAHSCPRRWGVKPVPMAQGSHQADSLVLVLSGSLLRPPQECREQLGDSRITESQDEESPVRCLQSITTSTNRVRVGGRRGEMSSTCAGNKSLWVGPSAVPHRNELWMAWHRTG